ncbi:hypothetical protein BT69DRAFT_897327 [Atractiella rhizophila]|nr:hypothetical protein BT69DRAFT_897327 [Atractiella rhizophila]
MTETLLPSPSVTEPRASTSGAASGVAGVAVGEAKRKTRAACDACHLRRVKCEYRNPGQPVCIKCEKKGIRCTSSFIKPYKPRTGKRIEQARSVYGILTPAIDSNGNELPSDSRLIAFSSALTIADQLFYADNANATGQHLIESQMEIMPYSLSNLVWPNVLGLIQQVNMRFEDLEDELQVVIACLLATGARASNHAAILGDSSQKIDDLWGKDLTAYGKTRGPMVHSLINRAVRLADRAGLMRRATLKSIVALLMLEQLLNQADPSCRSGYSYLSGACDHLRTLLGAEETPPEVRNQLLHHVAPFLFSRDALAAAASERFPNLTNWDLRAFFADSPFGLDAFLGSEDIQNREHWSKETRIIGLNIRIAALARAFLETASPRKENSDRYS